MQDFHSDLSGGRGVVISLLVCSLVLVFAAERKVDCN
jgi:hypothetical protein